MSNIASVADANAATKPKVNDDSSVSSMKSSLTKTSNSTKSTVSALSSSTTKLSTSQEDFFLNINDGKVTEDDEIAQTIGGKRSSYNSTSKAVVAKKAKAEPIGVYGFGVPKNVHHFCIQGKFVTAAAFVHFCELSRHYSKKCHFGTAPVDSKAVDDDGNKSSCSSKGHKKKQATLFSKKVDKKTFGNICLLCLRAALKQPNAPPDAWTAALCNVKDNSSNADKHLRNKHADEPETIEYLSLKDAKNKEKKANGLLSTGLLTEFAKSRLDSFREKTINWLIACGVPHEATQTEEFIQICCVFDPRATPPSRETYIAGLEKRFDDASL